MHSLLQLIWCNIRTCSDRQTHLAHLSLSCPLAPPLTPECSPSVRHEFTQLHLSHLCSGEQRMRMNNTFMHTYISTYTHTHTHVLMPKQYMHRAELWVCGKEITIQSQTNHTFALGSPLRKQLGEAGLAEGWDSWDRMLLSKYSVGLFNDVHILLSEIKSKRVRQHHVHVTQ